MFTQRALDWQPSPQAGKAKLYFEVVCCNWVPRASQHGLLLQNPEAMGALVHGPERSELRTNSE